MRTEIISYPINELSGEGAPVQGPKVPSSVSRRGWEQLVNPARIPLSPNLCTVIKCGMPGETLFQIGRQNDRISNSSLKIRSGLQEVLT
jgi:hypothetical protein